ncbi:MAG TPA: radical SAM protein [Tepidisphaeraceae bacterium]|nr:radical SAM protein [Tepidisphaeraceae bacterium]
MISTAKHPRPVPQTPRHSFPLPVIDPPGASGDPFSQYKILNHFDRLQAVARGEQVFPITVEIDPTNRCNHRCQWCVSMESHTGEMLDLERFALLVGELRQTGVRSVVLKGGGESSTHPHFNQMLEILRQAQMPAGLITNGSLPQAGTRDKVLECCQWVRVSLDAATAPTHRLIHGTTDFEKITANVAYLTAHASRTMVGLNFVAEARNCREMAQFAHLGKSLGAAYVSIRCVFDPANPLPDAIRDVMRQQVAEAKQLDDGRFRVFLGNFTDRYLNADPQQAFPYRRCLGPNLIGIVGGDSHVYACCFLRGNRQFSFGNLEEQSFTEIWNGPRRQEVMEAVYRGQCHRVCSGGMTANRYNTYNEILNYLATEAKPHSAFA